MKWRRKRSASKISCMFKSIFILWNLFWHLNNKPKSKIYRKLWRRKPSKERLKNEKACVRVCCLKSRKKCIRCCLLFRGDIGAPREAFCISVSIAIAVIKCAMLMLWQTPIFWLTPLLFIKLRNKQISYIFNGEEALIRGNFKEKFPFFEKYQSLFCISAAGGEGPSFRVKAWEAINHRHIVLSSNENATLSLARHISNRHGGIIARRRYKQAGNNSAQRNSIM